jgi:hypothetical protein
MLASESAGALHQREFPVSRDLARLRAFGTDTLLGTARGDMPASEIRSGDLLRTSNGKLAEVTWTDTLHLDASFIRSVPELRPVLFCAGDFGESPRRNVVLSPRQYVWYPDFETGGEFRHAADVTPYPNAYRDRDLAVTYVSILCDTPVIVEADGLWIALIP